MRTFTLATLLLLAVAVPLVPAASASEPNCLQVYPWSEFCNGNADVKCNPFYCIREPECIQVEPWSRLCGGDVVGFISYYVQLDDGGLLP